MVPKLYYVFLNGTKHQFISFWLPNFSFVSEEVVLEIFSPLNIYFKTILILILSSFQFGLETLKSSRNQLS